MQLIKRSWSLCRFVTQTSLDSAYHVDVYVYGIFWYNKWVSVNEAPVSQPALAAVCGGHTYTATVRTCSSRHQRNWLCLMKTTQMDYIRCPAVPFRRTLVTISNLLFSHAHNKQCKIIQSRPSANFTCTLTNDTIKRSVLKSHTDVQMRELTMDNSVLAAF